MTTARTGRTTSLTAANRIPRWVEANLRFGTRPSARGVSQRHLSPAAAARPAKSPATIRASLPQWQRGDPVRCKPSTGTDAQASDDTSRPTNGEEPVVSDAELTAVAAAWSHLSEPVRSAILELVRHTRHNEPQAKSRLCPHGESPSGGSGGSSLCGVAEYPRLDAASTTPAATPSPVARRRAVPLS